MGTRRHHTLERLSMASPLPRYAKSVGNPGMAVAGGIELRGDGRFEIGHRGACPIFVYFFRTSDRERSPKITDPFRTLREDAASMPAMRQLWLALAGSLPAEARSRRIVGRRQRYPQR